MTNIHTHIYIQNISKLIKKGKISSRICVDIQSAIGRHTRWVCWYVSRYCLFRPYVEERLPRTTSSSPPWWTTFSRRPAMTRSIRSLCWSTGTSKSDLALFMSYTHITHPLSMYFFLRWWSHFCVSLLFFVRFSFRFFLFMCQTCDRFVFSRAAARIFLGRGQYNFFVCLQW